MLLLYLSSAFASPVGLHVNGAWLNASWGRRASELGEGKPAIDQKPLPPIDGGLCWKSQAAAWWQVCVSLAPVSRSFIVLSAALAQLTTWQLRQQKKRVFFSWISFLLRSFPSWPCPGAWQRRWYKSRWWLCLPWHSAAENSANPKYLVPLLVWVTVSKWLSRQTLSISRFMTYVNSYIGKIYTWRNSFSWLIFPVP